MKKILAVLLAVALVATLSLSAVMMASADGEMQIVTATAEATKGETKEITIGLTNNTGIASIKLSVAYDSDLSIKSVKFADKFTEQYTYIEDDEEEKAPAPEYTADKNNPATINWISKTHNVTGDGTFVKIKFIVSESATAGDKDITVTVDNPNNVFYYASGTYEEQTLKGTETNVPYTITSGKITVVDSAVVCQHEGGTATCHSKAVCTTCGEEYGEFDANNHDGGTEVRDAKDATETEDGYTGDTYCLGCGALIAAGEVIPATGGGEQPASTDMIVWNGAPAYSRMLYRPDTGKFEAGTKYVLSFDIELTDVAEENEPFFWRVFYANEGGFVRIPHADFDITKTALKHGYHYDVKFTVPDDCRDYNNILLKFGDTGANGYTQTMKLANLDLWSLDGEDNEVSQIVLSIPATIDDVYQTNDTNEKSNGVHGKWVCPVNYLKEITIEPQNGYFDPIPECEHANTSEVAAVASTCHTAGHAAYTVCDDCGEIISGSDEELPLDPANHEGGTEVRGDKPATCSETGYTGDTICKGCGATIAQGKEIPLAEHTVGEWVTDADNHWHVCSVCTAEIDKAAHSGGTATCHSKAACTVCGAEYGEFDANNHDGGTEVRGDKPATCSETGYTGDTYCLGCGAKIADGKEIAKLAHTESEWLYDAQSHWKECTVCKEVIEVSAPHTFEEKVIKEPTTEAEGQKAKVCSVCGYTDESSIQTIDKLIAYDAEQTEGKTEDKTAVYDGEDAKAIAFTAKFAKNKLTAVKVNGEEVSSDNYTVTEDEKGNAVVKFTDAYLAKLPNGNYTIDIYADDGVATQAFTVKNNAAAAPAADTDKKSSKTGDMNIALLVFALIALMGASVSAGVIYRRKNESK